MKRLACFVLALGTIGSLAAENARADFGSLHYGGYQPWWNIFAKRNPYMSVEEERLQRFWHDYYDSLRRYYGMLDRIDWVAYYKNHGYQINTGCGPNGGTSRIQFAPVFVSPQMNWAVPNTQLSGSPCAPGCPPGGMFPNYQSNYQSNSQPYGAYYPSYGGAGAMGYAGSMGYGGGYAGGMGYSPYAGMGGGYQSNAYYGYPGH